MAGYTPGEQPRADGIIKLNTNENPYPPSPRVRAAIEEILASGRLRKYPDPLGTAFRQSAGQVLGVRCNCSSVGGAECESASGCKDRRRARVSHSAAHGGCALLQGKCCPADR